MEPLPLGGVYFFAGLQQGFGSFGILAKKPTEPLKISIIVAKAQNNVIGKDNGLVWRLSADLKRFKSVTTGHCIIMGRKTYESIGKPLPNRTSIVVTRTTGFKLPEGHHVAHSLEQAVQICIGLGEDEVFVIGGAEIYRQAMDIADELIVTEVHASPEGDAYFPEIPKDTWEMVSVENFQRNESNEYDFDFQIFRRK